MNTYIVKQYRNQKVCIHQNILPRAQVLNYKHRQMKIKISFSLKLRIK